MSSPWTRRHFRLGSGFILWVYVATHLSNHALGLVSLSAAERGLQAAVVVWHSVMGTGLLYAAFTIHLSLALLGLYQRHTLRLPPLELVPGLPALRQYRAGGRAELRGSVAALIGVASGNGP